MISIHKRDTQNKNTRIWLGRNEAAKGALKNHPRTAINADGLLGEHTGAQHVKHMKMCAFANVRAGVIVKDISYAVYDRVWDWPNKRKGRLKASGNKKKTKRAQSTHANCDLQNQHTKKGTNYVKIQTMSVPTKDLWNDTRSIGRTYTLLQSGGEW